MTFRVFGYNDRRMDVSSYFLRIRETSVDPCVGYRSVFMWAHPGHTMGFKWISPSEIEEEGHMMHTAGLYQDASVLH